MNLHVNIYSLGCSKNLIDSERLARRFADKGIDIAFDEEIPPKGSVTVVNTCGFIGDAKEESVNELLRFIDLKDRGHIKAVYVMGCLSERYRNDVAEQMPELDGIFGKFDWAGIVDEVLALQKASEIKQNAATKPWDRVLSTGPHYTYIKISEGCNRFCAFCAIPLITGRHTSRPADEILAEVSQLAANGTREFNIIAQDLSSYGRDLADTSAEPLADLIDRMADIEGVEMIRLHYAYPSDFPYGILPVMSRRKDVCKYLDIALQHIDDKVLTNMRRHIDADGTRALLERIRREVPGIHIRTTMMVGFPGEDDAAFDRLLDFVKEQRFERLGAFAYCEEDDTFAAKNFEDNIPDEVKQARLEKLMAVQEEIASEVAASEVGKTLRVIIDEYDPDMQRWIGRSEYDSPEVDCNVFVEADEELETGKIYNVKITDSDGFDLYGSIGH